MDVVGRWTGQLATALQAALRLTNEQFAADLGRPTRTIAKWHERPDIELREANQQDLDSVLYRAAPDVHKRFSLLATSTPALVRNPATIIPADDGEDLRVAALESSVDALMRCGQISAGALPELVQQVMHIARHYDSQSRMVAFRHARATRDLAVNLANTTRRPAALTDLYVAIGETNALMASLAFDLGNWDASASMARAATRYADLAGHNSLGAWTLGLEATLAFWRGDGDRSLDRIAAGLALAPAGEPRVRLLHISARAHAVRGDSDGAVTALRDAQADREIAEDRRDELHHEVAGEFRFDDPRAAACAGTAWLQIGNGDEALRYTRHALELHEQRGGVPLGILSGARIDTAAALLLQDNLDEARGHLEPVLAMGPDAGNASLGGRLRTVHELLTAPIWRGNCAAAQLADQVADWLRGSECPVGSRE